MSEPSIGDILAARGSDAAPEPEVKEEKVSRAPEAETEEPEVIRQSRRSVPDEADDDDATVPRGALEAEREKRRKYTDEVADTRRVLAEVQRQNAEMAQALLRLQQPQPQPQPTPQKPVDFDWDNPVEFNKRMIAEALAEERQRIADERRQEGLARQMQREAKELPDAISRHGEAVVKEAWLALNQAAQTDPNFGNTFSDIVQTSDNQYDALVKWNAQRKARAEIGDDPEAYKARIRAEYLEELRNGTAQTNGRDLLEDEPPPFRRPPRMPSDLSSARNVGSRSGPAFSEPSIKDILANR